MIFGVLVCVLHHHFWLMFVCLHLSFLSSSCLSQSWSVPVSGVQVEPEQLRVPADRTGSGTVTTGGQHSLTLAVFSQLLNFSFYAPHFPLSPLLLFSYLPLSVPSPLILFTFWYLHVHMLLLWYFIPDREFMVVATPGPFPCCSQTAASLNLNALYTETPHSHHTYPSADTAGSGRIV